MTFCVAAIFAHQGQSAIMCLTDKQGTLGDFVKTADTYKFRYEGHSTILLAGTTGHTDELISMLAPILIEYDKKEKPDADFDLRISDLLESIRTVVRKRKRQLTDHYLAMKYGVTFDEFLKNGSDWYSPYTYATILSEIQRVNLGCDLIYTYVHDYEPIIIEITDDGKVIWQDHYACIGSGSTIGMAILAQENWNDQMPLLDCAARLLMAKFAAESDPYVSEEGALDISIYGNDRIDDVSEEGFKYLYKRVPRIKAPTDLVFKPEFLAVSHSHPDTLASPPGDIPALAAPSPESDSKREVEA